MIKLLTRDEIKNLLTNDFGWEEEKAYEVADYFLSIERLRANNYLSNHFMYSKSFIESSIKVVSKEEFSKLKLKKNQPVIPLKNYYIIDLQKFPKYSVEEFKEALQDLDSRSVTQVDVDYLEDGLFEIRVTSKIFEEKNARERKQIVLNHLKEKNMTLEGQYVVWKLKAYGEW